MSTAIRFINVSKLYALKKAHTLSANGARMERTILRALDEVSFEVQPGEVIGLIGANGSGKSTMLKLMAGISRPTQGQVEIRGRVGSLIELGAGFHPELTGRENVFLNGQLMGMSRRQISTRYEEIVEFAELRDFMEVAIKRYSSGMYARLGFAVAAHMDPDILLVDEVLSVGDASFQRKSLERMLALVRSGKTVVFVSHNLWAVEHVCSQAMWLDHGHILQTGSARDVVHEYVTESESKMAGAREFDALQGNGLRIEGVSLLDGQAQPGRQFVGGRDLEVLIQYRASKPLDGARFNVAVADGRGLLFEARMLMDGNSVSIVPGCGTIGCRFRNVPLAPGAYSVAGEVWGPGGYEVVLPWVEWARFQVVDVDRELLALADNYSVTHLHLNEPVPVKYDWRAGARSSGG